MSLLSLFSLTGSGSDVIPADICVGFMGKVPARPDFVRHHANAPEIDSLDQWIHEGIAYLARRFPSDWKERLADFGRMNCYIGGDGSVPTLCGVIRPSQDKSGRQHPFMDFAICPNLPVTQALPYIGLRFEEFYRQGGNLLRQDGTDMEMEGLMQQSIALGRSIPQFSEDSFVLQRSDSWAGKTSADFWESILPGTSEISRLNFARDVLQTLRMAANRGPERIAWGLRLPLSAGAANVSIVSFWMSLIVGVLNNQKWRPHVFWFSQGKGESAITLYFRSPNASGFAQLLCPEVDEGGVVDVVRRPLENLPEITSVRLRELIEAKSLGWTEMLENWVKG